MSFQAALQTHNDHIFVSHIHTTRNTTSLAYGPTFMALEQLVHRDFHDQIRKEETLKCMFNAILAFV